MTCIIGTRKFLCADRRVTEDGASSSLVKLCKNEWIIAGTAGLATANLAVKAAVRAGAESAEDLLPHIDAHSYALVLSWDGRLRLVSEGKVWPTAGACAAIGSGADLALGYMNGAGALTVTCARAAQRFVARRRVDCGGGCDVRMFDR